MKVARDASAQPARDRGISKDCRTKAYFLVPELTMPHRNWNTDGMAFATTLDTHKLNQTISTQVKIHTIRTPPRDALGEAVAPTMIGTAIKTARGST